MVPPPSPAAGIRSRMLFGAAYYAEYQWSERVDEDLDLMKAAGFTVIRVGESVWSTWEPREGQFDTEWLRPVLDGAAARGISVILGTPTYAVPPWLQAKHPELATDVATGVSMQWGARQEVDYSSAAFRPYAERVIRTVIAAYHSHPAVIGFQVDNEPGMSLFHNEGTFEGFLSFLEARYGTVETLNREWGLVYWSHLLTSFDELWRPDGNSFPQYDLAWREYQASVTDDFIHWQADIVREYASADQFVTTCIAYPRPAQHDATLAAGLDVTAGNPYYDMQDALDLEKRVPQLQPWVTTGVAGLFRQADRLFSSRQEPFLVTETDAQSIGGPSQNFPPYPGQLKQAAYALVSRGARMIEYWHWHTLHSGFETYWGGVIPHSQVPGRIYHEVSELGASLGRVESALGGYLPHSDVAFLYSNASKWAFDRFPPLADGRHRPDPTSYHRIFDAAYDGVIESGRQARIVHDVQLADIDPAAFAAENPVLIAAGFYVASDDQLSWLNAYALAGGHLVLGIRTGYADPEARARREVAPPMLSAAAGASYEEYSNTHAPTPVRIADGATSSFAVSDDAAGVAWIDGLIPSGAEVVLQYDHPEFGRFPAMTTTSVGQGRISYLGTIPNPQLAADLARWLVPAPVTGEWASSRAVTVQSGDSDRGVIRFISNWSGHDAEVTTPVDVLDLESGDTISAGTTLTLVPRDTRILIEEKPRA